MKLSNPPVELLPYLKPTLGLWAGYLAVMWIKKHRARLEQGNKLELALAWIVTIFFVLLDFVYNTIVGTAMFRELPREGLFTARLKRHRKESSGWRLNLANWICEELLNKYDPGGKHC